MKKHYKAIFFLLGVAGIVLLAVKTNPDGLDWHELFTPKLPLLLLGLLALWALVYAVHARAFRTVMGEAADDMSHLALYRLCLYGFASNNVTPAGIFGGEPYRILELKKYMSTEKAASSTMSFTLMYVIGHMLLWLTGILIYFVWGCPGETYITVILIAAAVILSAVLIYFFAVPHSTLISPIVRVLSKLPLVGKKVKAFAEKNEASFADVDRSYAEFHTDKKKLLKVTLLEYGARFLESLEYFMIFRYLGCGIHLDGGILIYTLASLVGNLLFMVPMQAGTREGGMAVALKILGISSATGIMGGLIYRIRDLLCTTVGILLILTGRKKDKANAAAPEEKHEQTDSE